MIVLNIYSPRQTVSRVSGLHVHPHTPLALLPIVEMTEGAQKQDVVMMHDTLIDGLFALHVICNH